MDLSKEQTLSGEDVEIPSEVDDSARALYEVTLQVIYGLMFHVHLVYIRYLRLATWEDVEPDIIFEELKLNIETLRREADYSKVVPKEIFAFPEDLPAKLPALASFLGANLLPNLLIHEGTRNLNPPKFPIDVYQLNEPTQPKEQPSVEFSDEDLVELDRMLTDLNATTERMVSKLDECNHKVAVTLPHV